MAIAPIVLTVATKMIALIVGTVAGLKHNSIFGDYFLGREGGRGGCMLLDHVC
jgi:hypothetical protein